MRGRFRRLVTRSLVRVGSSQPLLFLASSVLGALLAVLFRAYEASLDELPNESYHQTYDWSYERWLYSQGFARVASNPDLARYQNRSTRYSEDQLDPDSEANFLFNKIKVFCLVFPTNADSAKAIKETWGKRCNKVFFYTAEEGKPLIPVIRTPSKSAFGLLCDSIRNIAEEEEDFHWLLVTTETTLDGVDSMAIRSGNFFFLVPFHYLSATGKTRSTSRLMAPSAAAPKQSPSKAFSPPRRCTS